MKALGKAALLGLLLAGVAAGCGDDKAPQDQTQRQIFAPQTAEAEVEELVDEDYRYDPTGKADPFKSFVKRNPLIEEALLSPLERFDLSQLTVTGIVWSTKNPRALIEDPTGKGYIVGEGAGIGKNKGRVVRIDDNKVIVKETYVDFHDKATSKEVELHLYERHGG